MLNQPASTTRQLGRYVLAAPLVMALALGYSSAQAQVAPTPAPAAKASLPKNFIYYVDGKLTSQAEFAKLSPDEISSVNVLKGEAEQNAFGKVSPDGTIIISTKSHATSPEVAAFNSRINSKVPLVPATPAQEAAIAAAAAYVTKNYPNARQEGVVIIPGKADRYQAVFMNGGQRVQLLFDGNGQPVKQ